MNKAIKILSKDGVTLHAIVYGRSDAQLAHAEAVTQRFALQHSSVQLYQWGYALSADVAEALS